MHKIMFVCTGNLCRSPMAEGLLRRQLADEGLEARYLVMSTGVWAVDGRPPSQNAITAMSERGIDISGHLAQTITVEHVAEADLILAMAREHETLLRSTWPQYAWKVHRLSEMVDKFQDVQDPYGGSVEEYRSCADTLQQYLEKGFQRILDLA